MNRSKVDDTPRAGGDSESSATPPGRSTAPGHAVGGTSNFPSAPGDLGEAGVALRFRASFNYGYDLAEYRDHPCACGSPDCVGYMVAGEFFPKLRAARRGLC